MESTSSLLSPWAVFFTLTGTSAASLTGLTFVVITLVRGGRRRPAGVTAFTTPTVVHFTAALMVSGILCIPWPVVVWPSLLLGFGGVLGMSYVGRVIAMALALDEYRADLEDWSWYMGLPLASYAAVFATAILFLVTPVLAPFAAAGAVALLILVGIHNAWDVVTYITIGAGSDLSREDGEN